MKGKLHKFTAYVVDPNADFNSVEELIDYINSKMKYGGDLEVFDGKTVDVKWTDNIDINQVGCPKETFDKYFK